MTERRRPVLGVDLDGTLGDFHTHFLRFAEAWYGRPMPNPKDLNPGLPLYKFMGTSKATYRKCKLAYRLGGQKRSMPVYPGAAEFIRGARRLGAEVWLCTTRPYLSAENIDPDTRHWLRRNRIQYNGLIWGQHKYRDLVKQVGKERIVAVLEDLPSLMQQAISLDLPLYIRDQPYNREGPDVPQAPRIYCFPEPGLPEHYFDERIADIFCKIQEWREEHG